MKNKTHILHFENLLVIVYITFTIFNFLFFIFLKQDSEDTISNRTKTPFPTYDTSGVDGFMRNIDKHYVDYFPFKYQYISFSNTLKAKLFNNLNASNSVVVGKQGWLFYNACVFDLVGMNEYTGHKPWTKEEVSRITEHIKTIENWCKRHQIKFEVIICPNKQSVYSEYLPAHYTKAADNRYDQLMEANPELMNIKKMFYDYRKKSKQQLYYKTDTHWNLFGAYLVCNELNNRWKTQFPLENFNQIAVHDSLVNNGFDLANMLALKDSYSDIMTSLEFQKPASFKIPHLVVVNDSYLGSMEPSLNYMFEKITQRHLFQDGIPSPEVLLKSKTDVFMIELVERYKDILLWDIHPDFYK